MKNKTKKMKCYLCTNEMVVSKYTSKYTICQECKNKGLISPIPTRDLKKTIKCYFCNNMVEVGSFSSNQVRCNECKKKGLITPDSLYKTEKRKKSLIEKYNVENVSKIKEVLEKKKKLREEKIETNPEYLNDIERKRKETINEKYGSIEEFYKIPSKGYYEKTGYNTPFENPEVQKKIQENNINPMKREEIKEKVKKTNLEKYGGNAPTCSRDVIKKRQNNNLEKHGVLEPTQLKEVQDKRKKTSIIKYGCDHHFKNKEIKEKKIQNSIKKWGTPYPIQSNEGKQILSQKNLEKSFPKILLCLNFLDLDFIDEKYYGAHYHHNFKCKICGFEFNQIWNEIQQGYKCPSCYPRNKGYSKGETEVRDFIKDELKLNIKTNVRSFIPPLEIDILIEEEKICIEYDGLWHHNENHTERKGIKAPIYHMYKVNEVEKLGYKLITIFEDEWIYKKDIVKERLKILLNRFNGNKVYARNCEVKEISAEDKNKFLELYHIQGRDIVSVSLGAFYNNELVSVMTFGKGNISKGSISKDGIWELSRFCSNYKYHVQGIAGKLLAYFKSNYDWKEIYSYADRRWSNGNLYRTLGFEQENKIRLNYWYVKGYKRIHRFNLRKREGEPKEIPEKILRIKEGYDIVWDCGNLKFTLKNK